ncbi:DUF6600 domain-containing protein, partial [Pedobacter westerhofensis]
MKNIIKLPAVILGLMLLVTGLTQNAMAQEEDDITLETFYEELAPYGRWAQDPEYGYVWQPNVDRNFRPYYTDGHWTMTEYGNTWVSDYEWGWAPFHYGRWVMNRYEQWIWIPDTEWGPAWVSWRSGDGYYGWAPLSPEYNNISDYGGYDAPLSWWSFIPQINIYSNNYPSYYNRGQDFYNRTAFINYTYRGGGRPFYTGPRIDDIRRVTRRDVTVYHVNTSNRPGRYSFSNNNINVYRPRVTGGRGSGNNSPGNPGRPNNAGNGRPGQPGNGNSNPGQPGRGNGGQPGRTGYTPSNGQNGQPAGNNGGRGNNDGRGNNQNGQPSGTNPGNPGRGNNGQPAGSNGGRGNNSNPAQPAAQPGSANPAGGRPEGYTPRRGNDQGQRPPVSRRDGIDRPQQMQQNDGQRAQQDLQRQMQMQQRQQQ